MLKYSILEGVIVLLSIITTNEIFAQYNYSETLTFVDPFGKFSIDYPSDWEAIAPGHSFQEGNLDLIIQKPDKKQGYVEIRDEQIIPEIKNSNKENSFTSTYLNNNPLDYMLSSLFNDYVSKLHIQNFQYIKKFYYDKNLILGMNTSSILYSFKKDNQVFYGLYVVAKSNYNLIVISYMASSYYFDKNLPKLEAMIQSLKFN